MDIKDLMKHSEWQNYMRHWVFVEDGVIYGYAPDNSCIAKETDIDTFFNSYRLASDKWLG